MRITMRFISHLTSIVAVSLCCPALAQNPQKSGTPASAKPVPLTYADMADLALAARMTVAVRVRQATRLRGAEAATTISGRRRYLVSADVQALIRAREAIPPRITYVIDVAPDSRGKMPKLTAGDAIIFAAPVDGYANEVRLVSPDAQIAATPDNLSRIRAILKEAESPGAPPVITGIGNAFHVPGTIPGEGETQIFLETADNRPVSISVERTNEAPPSWSIALGEVVDQGAGPPQRNSFLWYRLACFLPPTLPADSIESLTPDLAAKVNEDYGTVLSGLGTCTRTLKIRPRT
jgi:hypothetical protein